MKLDEITHVNYAFFDVTQGCAVASLDEYADFEILFPELGMAWGDNKEHGNIGAFQILKERHPHLSVVLSLGGWTKSTHFSACAKSAAKRQTLVDSALAMLRRTGFDGLDLDWEYPVCCGLPSNGVDPEDWNNYLLLLGELRAALDAEYPTVHKELSIAMGMGPAVTNAAPKKELAEVLDVIYMMTYDYNGAWPPMLTAHNAPLYPDPAYEAAGGQAGFNVEWGVSQWAAAVPPAKLVMGLAGYGRTWYGTTQLYATASGAGPGTYWNPPDGNEDPGMLRYDEITSDRFAHFTRHWSEPSQVPYMTGQLNGKDAFITHDDPQSIALKAAYAKAAGLGGLMWWEASEDPKSVLLLAANEAWSAAPPASGAAAATSATVTLGYGAIGGAASLGVGLGAAVFILAVRRSRRRRSGTGTSTAAPKPAVGAELSGWLPTAAADKVGPSGAATSVDCCKLEAGSLV